MIPIIIPVASTYRILVSICSLLQKISIKISSAPIPKYPIGEMKIVDITTPSSASPVGGNTPAIIIDNTMRYVMLCKAKDRNSLASPEILFLMIIG